MQRLEVDGWTVERSGEGTDTLLLLPDMLGGPQDLAPLAEWLSTRAEVILACPPAQAHLPSTLAVMEGQLKRWGIGSVVMVGIGHGGVLAQAWRRQHWSRARGMVLMDSAPLRADRAWRFEVGALALRSMPGAVWRSWVRQRSAYRHGPSPAPPAFAAASEAFEARLAAPDAKEHVLATLTRTAESHKLEQRSAWDGPVLVVEQRRETYEPAVHDWKLDYPARQLVHVKGKPSLAPLLEVETLATRVLAMLSTLPPSK